MPITLFETELPNASSRAPPYAGLSVYDPRLAKPREKAMQRFYEAADNLQRFVDNSDAKANAREEAYAQRNAAIEAAGGPKLFNPMLDIAPGEIAVWTPETIARQEARWHRETAELANKRPELRGAIRPDWPIQNQAISLAIAADVEYEVAAADPAMGAMQRFEADIAGGVVGSFRDPLQTIPSLLTGPIGGFGKQVLTRVLTAVGGEALSNAAIQAGLEVNPWRGEIGRDRTTLEKLERIAVAAGIGGAIGGGVRIGTEISTKAAARKAARAPQLKPIPAPSATLTTLQERTDAIEAGAPPPVPPPAAAAPVPPPAPLKPAESIADAVKFKATELADEEAAFGDPPPGVTPAEATAARRQAIEHAEDAEAPPPAGPIAKPPRDPEIAPLVDQRLPGQNTTIAGRPATFEFFKPEELGTDAKAFQYKAGGDERGVTDRLKNVTRWDRTASGKIMVFEYADGRRVIADGHQRLGLARRIMENNPEHEQIIMEGYLVREKDGFTPSEVRALAGKKNLQENSGTALDAARILRDYPEILDDSVPVSGPMMRAAIGMSKLSQPAWEMTLNGVIPENYAAAVGTMVPDPALHAPIVGDLARSAPKTLGEAHSIIKDAMHVGMTAEEQMGLFGKQELTRTLMVERAKVLKSVKAILASDQKLFSSMMRNADILEEAGNVLAREGNVKRKADAELVGGIVEKLAHKTGPVSSMLNREAAQLAAEAKSADAAAQDFVQETLRLINEQGLAALSLPEPQLKPAMEVPEPKPGEPAAPTAAELEAEGQASFLGGAPEAPAAAKPAEAPAPAKPRSPAQVPAAAPMTPERAAAEAAKGEPVAIDLPIGRDVRIFIGTDPEPAGTAKIVAIEDSEQGPRAVLDQPVLGIKKPLVATLRIEPIEAPAEAQFEFMPDGPAKMSGWDNEATFADSGIKKAVQMEGKVFVGETHMDAMKQAAEVIGWEKVNELMDAAPEKHLGYAKKTAVVEPGAEGKPQQVIPGAEQITQREMLERRTEGKATSPVSQEFGGSPLFTGEPVADVTAAPDQASLLDLTPEDEFEAMAQMIPFENDNGVVELLPPDVAMKRASRDDEIADMVDACPGG